MTPAEAAVVLAIAASLDNRTQSKEAATSWAAALNPRLTVEDAAWIIRDYYSRTRDWIMPSDVNERYRQIRYDRTKDMRTPEPPEALEGDPRREIEWQRVYRTAIGDGQNDAQADSTACVALRVTRAAIEAAPRPVTAMLTSHKGACSRQCGCLTRPIRAEERKP